ncbi:MAG: hypothetical protein J0L97_04195 [Alphaproteobacteria bacterium]|nr:hypothetical protein [Alphaproteobacteria bacterium]
MTDPNTPQKPTLTAFSALAVAEPLRQPTRAADLLHELAKAAEEFRDKFERTEHMRGVAADVYGADNVGQLHSSSRKPRQTTVISDELNLSDITTKFRDYEDVGPRGEAQNMLGWALLGMELFPMAKERGLLGLMTLSRDELRVLETSLGFLTHYMGNHPRQGENTSERLLHDVRHLMALPHEDGSKNRAGDTGALDPETARRIYDTLGGFLVEHGQEVFELHNFALHGLRHFGKIRNLLNGTVTQPDPNLPLIRELLGEDAAPDAPLRQSAAQHLSQLWMFTCDEGTGVQGVLRGLYVRLCEVEHDLFITRRDLKQERPRNREDRNDEILSLTHKAHALSELYHAFVGMTVLAGGRVLDDADLSTLSLEALDLLDRSLLCLQACSGKDQAPARVHALVYDPMRKASVAEALTPYGHLCGGRRAEESDEKLFSAVGDILASFAEGNRQAIQQMTRDVGNHAQSRDPDLMER